MNTPIIITDNNPRTATGTIVRIGDSREDDAPGITLELWPKVCIRIGADRETIAKIPMNWIYHTVRAYYVIGIDRRARLTALTAWTQEGGDA